MKTHRYIGSCMTELRIVYHFPRFKESVRDIGVSNLIMNTEVILFNALHLSTALLYLILLPIESQSSS